jgi:hypothetical protein
MYDLTQRERTRRRAERLARIQEQIADGRLKVRQASDDERGRWRMNVNSVDLSDGRSVRGRRHDGLVSVDASQAVRELLEKADEPLSTEQIIAALRNAVEPDEVQEALEHWHREIAAIEDASGKWSWLGPQ